jgi:hypothetical protein
MFEMWYLNEWKIEGKKFYGTWGVLGGGGGGKKKVMPGQNLKRQRVKNMTFCQYVFAGLA